MGLPAIGPPGRLSVIPPLWATLACWFRTTSQVYLLSISPTSIMSRYALWATLTTKIQNIFKSGEKCGKIEIFFQDKKLTDSESGWIAKGAAAGKQQVLLPERKKRKASIILKFYQSFLSFASAQNGFLGRVHLLHLAWAKMYGSAPSLKTMD
jgi:hypothetical protein